MRARAVPHPVPSPVIQFNCGCARRFRLDTRDEPDEAHPENTAHAHIYTPDGNNQRKKLAKAFLLECRPASSGALVYLTHAMPLDFWMLRIVSILVPLSSALVIGST